MVALAEDAFAMNCVGAAILTALTWDFVICFTEELRVAVICGFSRSILVYYTSRVGILMMGAMQLVIQSGHPHTFGLTTLTLPSPPPLLAARVTHCNVFWNVEMSVIVLASSATSLLFLLRVRAVYEKSTPITAIFGILWIAIPVSCVLVGIAGKPFQTRSGLCGLREVQTRSTIFLWVKAVYDTSVFAAITLRVISRSKADRVQAPKLSSWQSWRGIGMPKIFRALLHGAHQFYFVTIGVTLMGACAILLPIDPIDRVGLTRPSLAVESIMACRVFRKLVLSSNKARAEESERQVRVLDSIMLTTVLPCHYAPEERETNII
ncbi:hypothetical protein FIBSPDRAFT_1049788 [Athelia psychrophila]|uniref:G-protein coupled receptors family 2 profile 2 domain-containing protein n=1 Tax=Athelia psychrophila TaxID=1759441 RepID=A0A166BPU7_9AGAM|nr:hypothetical protein FIBSPDRAFT_1049788 [Fibularhizoctonia sp. CBS 109695]